MADEKKLINESDKDVIDSWFDESWNVTRETLPDYISKIMDEYSFDYGSYVYAVTACALATAHACGKELSGFQASYVGLQFVYQWTYSHVKSGISVRNWDDMLYPQYADEFCNTIPKHTWKRLQKEAKERIANYKRSIDDQSARYIHPDVLNHWQSIVDGKIPFGYKVSE